MWSNGGQSNTQHWTQQASIQTSLNRLFYYFEAKFMIQSFPNDFIDGTQYIEALPELVANHFAIEWHNCYSGEHY